MNPRPTPPTPPSAPDLSGFRSLLVVKPSSLGDIVHALPAVALLARAHPGLRLRWLVRPEFAGLLEGLPALEQAIAFPRARFRGPLGWCRAIAWAVRLRREQREDPELVLDLQGLARSALIARARCRRRRGDAVAGLTDAREGARFLHRLRIEIDADAHAVRRCLAAARALGAVVPEDDLDLPWPLPQGRLPDWWRSEPAVTDGAPYLVLHPFSRGHGKALSAAATDVLVQRLASQRVVIVGQRDQPAPPSSSDHVIDACNRTSLPELVAILRGAAGVISVDSGPAHLAAAVCPGPVISIHSRADPRKVGPWRADALAWHRGSLAPMRQWLNGKGPPVSGGHRMPTPAELHALASAVLQGGRSSPTAGSG